MIKKIAIVIAVLVAAVLVFAATRPPDFTVSRSLDIKAPPDTIFPLIVDFHQWARWSPYEKLDPAMQRRFEGAASGKGAVYAWSGDSKAGAGRMEILDAPVPKQIDIQLDFTKPIEGHNRATFTLAPNGDTTRVTWTMTGPSPYIAKLAGIFFNMDTMIGSAFESGLANIKGIVER